MMKKIENLIKIRSIWIILFLFGFAKENKAQSDRGVYDRERISINQDWKFFKYDSTQKIDDLIYDVRPNVIDVKDDIPADTKPTEAVKLTTKQKVLKDWILPTGNSFIKDSTKHYKRPVGNPGQDFPFVKADFNDSDWEMVNIPHDWAIAGPFFKGDDAKVGGGMGRLPSPGVAWYRKKIYIPTSDKGKNIFLDIDGAMAYAMVWINGKLAGGWPYGYSSFRLDLTPYLHTGKENQIAIRLDNPPNSSRWYPGGGIYRNIWLVKTNPLHVAEWGSFVSTDNISEKSALVNIETKINNASSKESVIKLVTYIYALDDSGKREQKAAASTIPVKHKMAPKSQYSFKDSILLKHPKLWGPPPSQVPHLYEAETQVFSKDNILDTYITKFGIRSIEFDGQKGVLVNNEPVYIKGVNQHHDLGALGAAFNTRAAERQLEMLKELGVNAIRMAHNPPAPELLELTDRMGFLVVDEIFDSWKRKKTPLDFHLIFDDWHEQDLRALIRRDRNHPSVILWSIGNEVGEQYTGEEGADIAKRLKKIAKDEDPTRLITASYNYAKPDMPITEVVDVINLNYQGEGIRNAPAYSHLKGISTPPLYPEFHKKFPDKLILSSENAATVSSRGSYFYPVTTQLSAPAGEKPYADPDNIHVSDYGLYTTGFGASPDKVFASLDRHPYVGGGFVWSGWDYLGEPTPYYSSRSSYFGIIDLAGFKKDRFYLYQSRWRPNHPMAHISPHWNWQKRKGLATPVHVFTSGDEAELFLNGKSLGKKKKKEFEYRLRWDDVAYEPGELKVIAYKNGKEWSSDIIKTTGSPKSLKLQVDHDKIKANGKDLAFITVNVFDEEGLIVPTANNNIKFEVKGPAEIVATDNGDPSDMTSFKSHDRKLFNGKALVVIRSLAGKSGDITVTAKSEDIASYKLIIQSR